MTCDSVHSVEKARKLTTEIDDVLHNDGFHVKGWLSNLTLKVDCETLVKQMNRK